MGLHITRAGLPSPLRVHHCTTNHRIPPVIGPGDGRHCVLLPLIEPMSPHQGRGLHKERKAIIPSCVWWSKSHFNLQPDSKPSCPRAFGRNPSEGPISWICTDQYSRFSKKGGHSTLWLWGFHLSAIRVKDRNKKAPSFSPGARREEK